MTIPTLSEAMMQDARDAIQLMFHADTAAEFDKILKDARYSHADDADGLVRLISLAYTAHMIADIKDGARAKEMHGEMAEWYREEAQGLLCRAVDAIAAIGSREADRRPGDLN